MLLRQYLRLGAKLLGFNVDPDFGDALDGLVFTPGVDFVGTATLQVDVNDLGHSNGPAAFASATVDIVVTDADGAPVPGAGVAVVIADEAVLALTGYELADPLDVFYRPIGDATSTTATRSSIELTRSDLAAGLGAGDAADDAGAGDESVLPRLSQWP